MNNTDPVESRCIVEEIEPTLDSWHRIKDEVMTFERAHFGLDFEEDELIGAFENPEATIIIVRDPDISRIIGFMYTEPVKKVYRREFHPERKKFSNTAYIQNTAIDSNYIGHKLVGKMTRKLEQVLISKGYTHIERDAVVANQYAANIQKIYRERILCSQPHGSKWGNQVFFRIKL